MPSRDELKNGFRIGEYEVLPARRVIRKDGIEQSPEPKVFDVLISLAMRDGDVVSRDELVDEVWDGRATSDGPINRAATQLRGHFDDKQTPYRYVEAKHKVGYRLNQPVVLNAPAKGTERSSATMLRGVLLGAALLAAVAIGIAIDKAFRSSDTADVESIGVQPFVVASDAPGDEYIATGLKEELLRTLASVSEVTIKNGRVSYPDIPVETIARRLDVDIVLTAVLLRFGERLEIRWRAERANDGAVIESGAVRGDLDDIYGLQTRLVSSVRSGLFPDAEQALITGKQPTGAGTESYYLGLHAMERRGEPGNLSNAIEHFQASIRLDPDFGPAYLALATAYALLPDLAGAPVAASHRLAIETVNAGVRVDGSIEPAASAIHGFVHHKEKRWQDSELAYQRAVAAPVVDSNAFNWYSRMLASVGRLDASLEAALKAQRIDPDSSIINSRVAIAYTWVEDARNAAKFFDRSAELDARGATHLLANALFLLREGKRDSAKALAETAVRQVGGAGTWIDPVFAAIDDAAQRGAAIEAVDVAAQSDGISPQVEFVVRTMLGDVDGAMRLARRLEQPGEIFEMDLLYIREMRPLREHPEFSALMDSLGVTDYWATRGCALLEAEVRCEAT